MDPIHLVRSCDISDIHTGRDRNGSNGGWLEVRSIYHLVDIHTAEGGLLLFSLLWLLLIALALFFVASISGGAWLLTGAVRTYHATDAGSTSYACL